MSHKQIMPPHLTPTTPEQLALYRTEHQIVPVQQGGKTVCQIDGIELWRKGFYGHLHSLDVVRRLSRIERGEEAFA